MNMTKVRSKAKSLGLKTGKMKKEELIQTIQKAEGNAPCYKPSPKDCDQVACCWRADCIPDKKKKK